ncbi:MAG: XRE family transcriptional regulator [Actinomycetota bacterium]|nr:XRE family transcriptional regulator [Actinomycetota bacterium]
MSGPKRQERMEEKSKAHDAVLNLAELREGKGLTQAELATRLGVSQPNVSKLEAACSASFRGFGWPNRKPYSRHAPVKSGRAVRTQGGAAGKLLQIEEFEERARQDSNLRPSDS